MQEGHAGTNGGLVHVDIEQPKQESMMLEDQVGTNGCLVHVDLEQPKQETMTSEDQVETNGGLVHVDLEQPKQEPMTSEEQGGTNVGLAHVDLEQPTQEKMTGEAQSSSSEQQDQDPSCRAVTSYVTQRGQTPLLQSDRLRKSLPAAKLISKLTLHIETLRGVDEAWFKILASVQTPQGGKNSPAHG